jgi:tRNA modification GTPase
LDGIMLVLQDCAGLGGSADELELATHLAAERTAQQADLVLWVHAADGAWTPREIDTCLRVAPERRVLVRSKIDLVPDEEPGTVPVQFVDVVAVSAADGTGLAKLRRKLAARLGQMAISGGDAPPRGERRVAAAALRRARAVAEGTGSSLPSPELVALELRAAYAALSEPPSGGLDEALLGRIFSQFCVGK